MNKHNIYFTHIFIFTDIYLYDYILNLYYKQLQILIDKLQIKLIIFIIALVYFITSCISN